MRITIISLAFFMLFPTKITLSEASGNTPSLDALLGLPRGLLNAICTVESNLKPSAIRHNDGGSDSIGLCQIKLSTARSVGYRGNARQLFIANRNMYYAGKYLAWQIKRYHGDYAKAVTAYNQGTCYSHGGSRYLAQVFTEWSKENL